MSFLLIDGAFDASGVLPDLREMKFPQRVGFRALGLHPVTLAELREVIPGSASPGYEAGTYSRYGSADALHLSLSNLAQLAFVRGSAFQVAIGEDLPPVGSLLAAEEAPPAEVKRGNKKAGGD